MFTHGWRSRGWWGGGGGGGGAVAVAPSVLAKFLQNLPFLPQIVAFLCLQPPHVPVSPGPHFQIHSAVHVTRSSLRNLTNITTCHFLKHFVKHSNICNICEPVFSSTSLQDKENTVAKTVKNLTFYGSVLDRMILK